MVKSGTGGPAQRGGVREIGTSNHGCPLFAVGYELMFIYRSSVPTVSDRTWLQALTLAVPLCKKRGFRATVLMLAGANYSSTRFLTTQFIRWTRTGLSKAGIPVPSESRAIKPSRLSASIFHDSSLPRIAQGDCLIKFWNQPVHAAGTRPKAGASVRTARAFGPMRSF